MTLSTDKGAKGAGDADLPEGFVEHAEATSEIEKSSKSAIVEAASKGQTTTGYEHLTIWETAMKFKTACFISFAAAFSAGNDGYQIGINASIIANKGFVQQFATGVDEDGEKFLESPILSGWASIMSVGQIAGMTTVPFISNRFGRKVAFYWLLAIVASSVLAECLARKWSVWLVAKFLAGMGIGSLQASVSPYIAEVAPTRIRGALITLYTLWYTVGSFFAQLVLWNLNAKNPYNWLTPVYTQWGQVAIMAIIYILLLPETPAWCATHGKEEEAKKAIRKIYRDVPDYDVDHHYNSLVMLLEHERTVAVEQRRESWYAIFSGTDGRRTLISLWCGLSQQFIGLKLFATFGTYFFQQAGVAQPFTVKCITSSVQIATVFVNIAVTDKIGRRVVATWAVTLMWVSCLVVGILGVAPEAQATTYVFVVFACFWNMGLVSLGSTMGSLCGETSSQRLRVYTSGFAWATTCVAGVIMDVLVPYMVNAQRWNWGLKTGWFYAGLGSIAVLGMWYLIPETKGRSSAELDELFERKIKAWRFAKTETATQRLLKAESAEV